jgi:hypothetical protein
VNFSAPSIISQMLNRRTAIARTSIQVILMFFGAGTYRPAMCSSAVCFLTTRVVK